MSKRVVSQRPEPVIAFIGATGTGKSATCNTLCGSNTKFPVSDSIDSCTYKTTVECGVPYSQEISAMTGPGHFTLIDTPGLGDSGGRDSEHIAQMVKQLKEIGRVNAFVIVFNGENPRMDEHLRSMMNIFADVFGVEYLQHVVLCFTRWSYDKKAMLRRPDDAEEQRSTEFNERIRKDFKLSHGVEMPCVFIDNSYENERVKKVSEPEELKMHYEQLCKLRRIAESRESFTCQDITAVLSQKDALNTKCKGLGDKLAKMEDEKQKIVAEKKKAEAEKKKAEAEKKKAEAEKKKADAAARKAREDAQKREAILLEQQERDRKEWMAERERAAERESAAALRAQERLQLQLEQLRMPVMRSQAFFSDRDSSYGCGSGDDYDRRLDYRAPEPSFYRAPEPSFSGGGDGGQRFYKGGWFIPGGGRAPKGGCYV